MCCYRMVCVRIHLFIDTRVSHRFVSSCHRHPLKLPCISCGFCSPYLAQIKAGLHIHKQCVTDRLAVWQLVDLLSVHDNGAQPTLKSLKSITVIKNEAVKTNTVHTMPEVQLHLFIHKLTFTLLGGKNDVYDNSTTVLCLYFILMPVEEHCTGEIGTNYLDACLWHQY